jgi:hypothetical protein
LFLSYLEVEVSQRIAFISSHVVRLESTCNRSLRRLFDDGDATNVRVCAGGLDLVYALTELTVLLATALGLSDAFGFVSFQLFVIHGYRATSLLVSWQWSVKRSGPWLGWSRQGSSLWIHRSGF